MWVPISDRRVTIWDRRGADLTLPHTLEVSNQLWRLTKVTEGAPDVEEGLPHHKYTVVGRGRVEKA